MALETFDDFRDYLDSKWQQYLPGIDQVCDGYSIETRGGHNGLNELAVGIHFLNGQECIKVVGEREEIDVTDFASALSAAGLNEKRH